jgi:hypothetical protein
MVVSADLIADGLMEEGMRAQKADAASIEAAFAEAGRGEEPLDEVAEVVEGIANRPDTLGVYLVDGSETVIASRDESEVGERDDNPHFRAALRDGRSYAGPESESDEGAATEFESSRRCGSAASPTRSRWIRMGAPSTSRSAPRGGRRRSWGEERC